MGMFRLLNADEIECRVSQVMPGGKGLTLLLYKTARTDADLLDETVGQKNWQNDFVDIKGRLFGRIGIKIDNEWIWKSDCGSESNMEAEKGEASDAYKRAGFKWGIGRELYSAPRIYVPSDKCDIRERNGKYACYDHFSVEKIVYNERGKVSALAIWNDTQGKRAFVWQAS